MLGDRTTIYFDIESPRRMKILWIAGGLFLISSIYQGWQALSHLYGSTKWIGGIIQIFCGVAIFTVILVDHYLNKKYGRSYVVFSDEGLKIKAKRRGEKIAWDDIRAMHLKINGIEIIPKAQPTDPIEIPAGTCSYTQFQEIKKNLKEYSAKYRVESNF